MKEGAVIRFLLVALPGGLLLLGVAAMVSTHLRSGWKPEDPNEAKRLEAAALMRRPVAREHLAASVEMLAGRIGERNAGRPDALEQAAVWIESMLGPGNLGYLVEHQVFEAEGREFRNLVAELPGKERRREIILVGASYDTPPGSPGAVTNASGVASLLALARALAGDPQERTLRFVAFAQGHGASGPDDFSGSAAYARRCRERGEQIVAMLCPDSLGLAGDGGLRLVGDESARYFLDAAKVAFSAASELPVRLADPDSMAASGRSEAASFARVEIPAVLATARRPLEEKGAAPSADRPEAVSIEALEDATRGLEGVLRAWANPSGGN